MRLTPDQRAKLAVYSISNDDFETPGSYIDHHLNVGQNQLTYNRVTSKFFAISGKHGEESVFYSRCNFAPQTRNMHCVYIEYPESDEKTWDRIVTWISRSLSGG